MEEQREQSLRRDLYICQMFGFTPKAFVDFFYNAVSRVASDALVEINNQIGEQPELSKDIDPEIQKEGFEKLRKIYDRRLELNVDRLEFYLINNLFRIPDNVVLPSEKLQEEHCCTKEDEDKIDQKMMEIKNRIKASYQARIDLQKESCTIDALQTLADEFLERFKANPSDAQVLFDLQKQTLNLQNFQKQDKRKTQVSYVEESCQNAEILIESIKELEKLQGENKEGNMENNNSSTMVTPKNLKRAKTS